jgi:hypothetical protein
MQRSGLRDVVEDRRANALAGWLLVVFLVGLAVADFAAGNRLWAGFALAVAVIAVIPAVAYRSHEAMLPWEVLVLASLPLLSRALVTGQRIDSITLTGRVSTYLAVAAVALILAIELDVFTPVRMNYTFAVFFVVVATMAAAGIWAVLQWLSDIYLGTALILDGRAEHVIERALMWDFVAATLAGLLAGVVFELYFRRRARTARRLPPRVVPDDAAVDSAVTDGDGR